MPHQLLNNDDTCDALFFIIRPMQRGILAGGQPAQSLCQCCRPQEMPHNSSCDQKGAHLAGPAENSGTWQCRGEPAKAPIGNKVILAQLIKSSACRGIHSGVRKVGMYAPRLVQTRARLRKKAEAQGHRVWTNACLPTTHTMEHTLQA